MKILLIGEYSRLHNSLKEGLTALGHEVTLLSAGDHFKKYDTDISIYPKFTAVNPLGHFAKRLMYRLTGINLQYNEHAIRFRRLLPKLKGYDHVQLINSDALQSYPGTQIKLFEKLMRQNGTLSLLICGDETPVIDSSLKKTLQYSVLTPYLENKGLSKQYSYSLKYVTNSYRRLYNRVAEKASVIITSDLDYEIPMKSSGYKTVFIPNPVNTDKLSFTEPDISGRIFIFLGINRMSYTKKGIRFFEGALQIIKQKYPDKAEIIITENIPYAEYIQLYDRAHILLDQVYSYDQGYNALEAMAKGKVVFTGAEREFYNHYQPEERVAVNALPDTPAIVEELSFLIENPDEIVNISRNARKFVEREHNYIKIAQQYLNAWQTRI